MSPENEPSEAERIAQAINALQLDATDNLIEAVEQSLEFDGDTEARRREIVDVIQAQRRRAQVTLMDEVRRSLTAGGGATGRRRGRLLWFVFLICSIFIVAAGLSIYLPPAELAAETGNPESQLRTLLFMLGFVVALASYLASTSREIVNKLSTVGAVDKRRKYRDNIFYMSVVEVSLIVIGLGVIFRIFGGPHIEEFDPVREFIGRGLDFDAFLVTYLAITLAAMAGLHLWKWVSEKPWKYS